MKTRIPHEMLVANAGSGKTYALTTRVIKLLALGVEPRKIAALTFTNKAAGEFLDAVFERLARAAVDREKLAELRTQTELPELDAAACRAMLARLVRQLGCLSMGTIDSLFARIARAFPFEAGLSGQFTMLGESRLDAAREEALAALFESWTREPAGFAGFLDLVRQRSRAQGDRDVFGSLLKAVGNFQENYLTTPGGLVWGDPKTIWPNHSPVLTAPPPEAAAEAMLAAICETHPGLESDALAKWENNLDLAATAGESWPPELAKFVEQRLCKSSTDRDTEQEYLPEGRAKAARVYLNERVAAARTDLLRALLKPVFEKLLRQSRALHGFLRGFEEVYDRLARAQGLLTFSDITHLLGALAQQENWRATVGYRLDTRFDHWLLDEFQDTSRAQWNVLSQFIDEVVQDTGGQRSFFYVGDTKQAIYLWRGGDPRLFFEIHNHYNASGENRIQEKSLDTSFRSAPEIIGFVNRVFGNVRALAAHLELPERTIADWEQAWRPHAVAEKNQTLPGFVRWVAVQPGETRNDNDEDDESSPVIASPQDAEILAILDDVEPWKRGLKCAALKRTNRDAATLAAVLQEAGIPVSLEGKSNPCTDNPLGTALLAAFTFVASPANQISCTLFAGSPLGRQLLDSNVEDFRNQALRDIQRHGFAGTTRLWIGRLDLASEPFLSARGDTFLAAAAEFDEARTPSDGVAEFVAHIQNHQVQAPEGAGVVRIMTVHQAKGLTFDMAIVSDLGTLGRAPDTDALVFGGGDPPKWGMLPPKKAFAQADPVLREAHEEQRANSAYGSLCAAYVAVTRPRHALYLVTDQLKQGSTAKTFGRILQLTLDNTEYTSGNPAWYELRPILSEPAPPAPARAVATLPAPAGLPRPLNPSRLGKDGTDTVTNFHPGAEPGSAGLGSEVHALLAEIDWLGEKPPVPIEASRPAKMMIAAFLADPVVLELFTRPESPHLLWRERAFDLLLDGTWISGVFDRVLVRLDAEDRPVSARIWDFKTDRLEPAEIARRYEGQMQAYRQAAARLLGLEEQAVRCETVPVRRG